MFSFESPVGGLDNSLFNPCFTKTFIYFFFTFCHRIITPLRSGTNEWGLVFVLEDSFLEDTQPAHHLPGDRSSCSFFLLSFKASSCCFIYGGPLVVPSACTVEFWRVWKLIHSELCAHTSSSRVLPAKFLAILPASVFVNWYFKPVSLPLSAA